MLKECVIKVENDPEITEKFEQLGCPALQELEQ